MKTFSVYGVSDDLIEANGISGADEFPRKGNGAYCGTIRIEHGASAVLIHCLYSGGWSFAVSDDSDDGDFSSPPHWPVRRTFGDDCKYSETVFVNVPDDATCSFFYMD